MITTTTPESEKPPPLEKQATVGNYFVSNYPPFSFWKPEFVPDVYSAMERPPTQHGTQNAERGTPLGIYVHIPFCRKRCHFCYFKVYTDRNAAAIQEYIDAVLAELRMYAGRAFLAG